jgi:hypothetical protein
LSLVTGRNCGTAQVADSLRMYCSYKCICTLTRRKALYWRASVGRAVIHGRQTLKGAKLFRVSRPYKGPRPLKAQIPTLLENYAEFVKQSGRIVRLMKAIRVAQPLTQWAGIHLVGDLLASTVA